MKISWFYPDFQGLESSFGPFKLVIGDAHRAPNISVTIGVKRFCPGFEVLKPILHGLRGQKNYSHHLNFLLIRGTQGRFPGLDLPKRAGFQVWTPQTCRFSGLDLPKRADFQVWTPQTRRFPGLDLPKRAVSRFGPPKRAGFQVSRLGPPPPKRAGFQTCRFPGLNPPKR